MATTKAAKRGRGRMQFKAMVLFVRDSKVGKRYMLERKLRSVVDKDGDYRPRNLLKSPHSTASQPIIRPLPMLYRFAVAAAFADEVAAKI